MDKVRVSDPAGREYDRRNAEVSLAVSERNNNEASLLKGWPRQNQNLIRLESGPDHAPARVPLPAAWADSPAWDPSQGQGE